ncbi:MAG: replication initiation protein [Paraclostridium sp.]
MKNIIVNNYLRVDRDLIGCAISLNKPVEISLFLEVCRIKQVEVLAKKSSYCDEFDNTLVVNKKDLSEVISKSILKNNVELLKLENNGVSFLTKDFEEISIIESVTFDKIDGSFTVEFNEYNFMKYFINYNDNFTKIPTELFNGLKSKNASMILLWTLKFSNLNGYKFMTKNDLCFLLGKDLEMNNKDLKRDLTKALEQLVKLGIVKTKDDKVSIVMDKNNNFNMPITTFDVNVKKQQKEDSTIKNVKVSKETIIRTENFSEDEIRIYGGL